MNRLKSHSIQALGLFGLLAAIYFATYTGYPVSTDEWMLFDAARSAATDGTFELPYTFNLQPFATRPGDQAVGRLDIEPAQVYGAAALITVARLLPGVGLMQAAWLFNIGVTALVAVVLFYYGVLLGYRQRTALLTALAFGLGSIVWPYTQMFFREPLLMLFILLAAYATERARRRSAPAWYGVAALYVIGAALTKEAGPSILPALLIIALPDALVRRIPRRVLMTLIAVGGLALVGAGIVFRSRFDYLPEALAAYLISPGFSVWVFTPALVIGWFGAIRLWRARQWRELLAPLITLLLFAIGHASVHGTYWYGGLGWGPRFLVPVTPFLMLWLLPVLDNVRGWRRALVGAGLALSFAVQVIAICLPTFVYSRYLNDESQRLGAQIVAWQQGVWDVRYNAIRVNFDLIGDTPSAIAWDVTHRAGDVLPLCALAAAISVAALAGRVAPRVMWIALPVTLLLMAGFGLRAVYRDPRLGAQDPALWQALEHIQTDMQPGDTILLNSPDYRAFFMNFYKGRGPIYAIPTAQGETVDPDEPPFVVSDNPEERADPYFQILLARLALRADRWWFFTDYNPFTPNRLRVTEHYLARHYFPLAEVMNEPTARLLLYAPIGAPPDTIPPWPSIPLGADFGVARLIGADLPRGTSYKPGAMLPVSLLWTAAQTPDFEYSVNITLIGADGLTRAQRVAGPGGTFAPMTLWAAGGYYRDNHALQLPADLPPGEYELWALLTDWRDGSSVPLRDGRAHVVVARVRVE